MSRFIAVMVFAAIALTGCAGSYKPGVYDGGAVQQKMKVSLATVVDVREVEIAVRPTGAGASAGASTGAVIGATSMDSRGGIVTSIAGAVIGGVAGHLAEKGLNAKKGVEIVYKVDGASETLALVQEQDDTVFAPGDRIRIMEGSFSTRAVKLSAAMQTQR